MITLADIGERRLIAEVLSPRYSDSVPNFGDDTAIFPGLDTGAGYIVGSTDPCPEPAAGLIGIRDPAAFGHLLAAINLSDLAAAGATPAGVMISLELPGDTKLEDFLALLDGIDGCCHSVGTTVVGGNLKEAARRAGTGFVLGHCETPPMSRSGAQPGDLVVVLGSLGLAWSRVLAHQHNIELPRRDLELAHGCLLWPRPLVALGQSLRRRKLANACTDASDGVMAAVASLAKTSGRGVRLDLDSVNYSDPVRTVAGHLDIHPWCLARTWGDWQLVCAVPRRHAAELEAVAEQDGTTVNYLGTFTEDTNMVGRAGDREGIVNVLDSERFVKTELPFLAWYGAALVETPPVRATTP